MSRKGPSSWADEYSSFPREISSLQGTLRNLAEECSEVKCQAYSTIVPYSCLSFLPHGSPCPLLLVPGVILSGNSKIHSVLQLAMGIIWLNDVVKQCSFSKSHSLQIPVSSHPSILWYKSFWHWLVSVCCRSQAASTIGVLWLHTMPHH